MVKRFAILIIFVLLLCTAVYAQGSFSYDSQVSMDGANVMQSSNFIKDRKIRMEYKGQMDYVFISNGQQIYLYYPANNMAMVLPANHPQAQSSQEAIESLDYKNMPGSKSLGEETFEGHVCEVYEYQKDGGITKVWIAKDLQFPVKMETNSEGHSMVSINRNIKTNANLADSLFELPAGAQTMDMGNMSEMMNNMKGMSSY
jgi:outer membrane lipoprotein-sorting protein